MCVIGRIQVSDVCVSYVSGRIEVSVCVGFIGRIQVSECVCVSLVGLR